MAADPLISNRNLRSQGIDRSPKSVKAPIGPAQRQNSWVNGLHIQRSCQKAYPVVGW